MSRINTVDFISKYEQEDKIPISKLKAKYITVFFDNIVKLKPELNSRIHEYEDKFIIDPEKAFIITKDGWCFCKVFSVLDPEAERKEIRDWFDDKVDSYFCKDNVSVVA